MSYARFAAPIVLALVTLALLMGPGSATNAAGSAPASVVAYEQSHEHLDA